MWKSLHEGQGRSRSRVSIATPAMTRICRPAAATASSGDIVVDSRVRRVVADCLGTDADELSAGVSLTDDLAADSLDLVDLAVALEAEFGIAVPDMVLDETRTYSELVDAIDALVRARRKVEAERDERRGVVRSLLAPPAREDGGVLARMSRLWKWDFQAPSSAKPRPA
jgi:acyl carrier protein